VAPQGGQVQEDGAQTQSPGPVQSQAEFVEVVTAATAQTAAVSSSATLNTDNTTNLVRMEMPPDRGGGPDAFG
jgi:hypothetical protein